MTILNKIIVFEKYSIAYSELDELVEKLLAKCKTWKESLTKTPTSNFKHYTNTKRKWTPLTLIFRDRHKFNQLPIFYFITTHQFMIRGSQNMDLGR